MIPLQEQLLQRDGMVTLREPDGKTVRIAAAGDMAFHGDALIAMREREPGYFFAPIRDALSGVDLAIGNLESVHVEHPFSPLTGRACLVAARDALAEIAAAGFDVMTFANNHIGDAGPDGVADCLEGLREAGLQTTGAGLDRERARVPATCDVGGQRWRVFAYSYGCGQIAGPGRPGCNEAAPGRILEDLRRFAEPEDLLVVTLHMDAEFQATPAPDRIALCRRLAEAGAHLVLCHHPHVPQGIEVHAGSLIVYSLGNFVFPMSEYMRRHSGDCATSFLLTIDVDHHGPVALGVDPVVLEPCGRPVPATGDERTAILSMIAERSRLLGEPEEVLRRYRSMTRAYTTDVFKNIYWAFGERDWSRLGILARSLRVSSTHRKWIRHHLFGRLTGN